MLAMQINPQLPAVTDVLAALVIGAALLLRVAALFSIWRRRERMDLAHVLVWFAIVIFAPFVGSLVWFGFGTRLHRAHAGDALPASARSMRL